MTPTDELEMRRLCDLLGTIDASLPEGSPLREGVVKGALSIQATFIHGRRTWVEKMYNGLDNPATKLTEEQRAHLMKLGIDP
jgi:hypothetical protein